jgi:hypothetical protein
MQFRVPVTQVPLSNAPLSSRTGDRCDFIAVLLMYLPTACFSIHVLQENMILNPVRSTLRL